MRIKNDNLIDAYFQTRFAFDPRRDTVWKAVCQFIQEHYIPEDSAILDLGAGYCNFINNVRGREKHAIDIFSKFSEYANPDVITHIQNCTDMPFFEDSHFDVIFASNLLEHMTREDSLQVLYETSRVLKPDGKIILLQPNFRYCAKTYFDDYTHLQIFTDRGLCDLLEATGFKIIANHARFLPVNMKSTLTIPVPKLSFFVSMYLRLPLKPFAGQMLIVARNCKSMAADARETSVE
jgi:SAM-dependent methyltransferase